MFVPVLRSTYVSLPPRPQQKDGTHINTCVVLCSSLATFSARWHFVPISGDNERRVQARKRKLHKNKTKFAHGRLQCSIVCMHTYGSYNMYSTHGGHRIRRIRKCRPRRTAGRAVHALAFIESTLGPKTSEERVGSARRSWMVLGCISEIRSAACCMYRAVYTFRETCGAPIMLLLLRHTYVLLG